jgi:Zn-dependent M16 (insulinase) family peptidase
MFCPPDPMAANPDKQTTVSVAFLLGSLADMDPSELFVLNILCSLLIKGPNSSFYKSLLASNIGSGYAPSTGMNGHTKEAYFAVGLQNIARDDVEKVRALIEQTIDQVIEYEHCIFDISSGNQIRGLVL